MSLIYLPSVPYVNEFCGYMQTTLTQNTQEDLTERNLGNALAFPLPENDPIRAFGMPRNVLLDVSQLQCQFFAGLNCLILFSFVFFRNPHRSCVT